MNNELNVIFDNREEALKVKKLIFELKEKTKRVDPNVHITWKHYLQLRFWIWWVESSEIVMNKRKINKILFNPDLQSQDTNIANLTTKTNKIFNTWDDSFGTYL